MRNPLTVMDRNLLPSFTSAATVPNMVSPAELPSAASQFSLSLGKESVPSQDRFRNDTVQAALAKGPDVDPKELAMKLLAGIATKKNLDKPIGSWKPNKNESLSNSSKQGPSSSSATYTKDETGPKDKGATKQSSSSSSITMNSEINPSNLALELLARAGLPMGELEGGNSMVPPSRNISDSSQELGGQGLPEKTENVKSNGPEALGAHLLASSAFNSSSDDAKLEHKKGHEEKGSVSPEALKKISQREFVQRSRTIAENVVLGPATLHNETNDGSNSQNDSCCVSSVTLNFASLTPKSIANASALANNLLKQTKPSLKEPSPPKLSLKESLTKECPSIGNDLSLESSCIGRQKTDTLNSEFGPKATVNNTANSLTSSINDTKCNTPTNDSSTKALCSGTNDLSSNPGNTIMCTPMKDLSNDNGNCTVTQQLNILDMLSEMADEAGTEDAATSEDRTAENWCSTTTNTNRNSTSAPSSLPKSIAASDLPPDNDNIPMLSNITFEFSIDSLLNDEVLPEDKQPELAPKKNPTVPSISDKSLTISKTSEVQYSASGSIRETEKALNVSIATKSVPEIQRIISTDKIMSVPLMQDIGPSDATTSVSQGQRTVPSCATTSVSWLPGINPSDTLVPQIQGIGTSSTTMSVPQMQDIGSSDATTLVPQETCQRGSNINASVGAIQVAKASNVDFLAQSEPDRYVSPGSQFPKPSTQIHSTSYSPRRNSQSPRLGSASHVSLTDSAAGHSDGHSSRGSTPGASAKTPPALPYSVAVHRPSPAIAQHRNGPSSITQASVSHMPPSVASCPKSTSRESNHRHSSFLSNQAPLYSSESRPSESLDNYNPASNQTFPHSVANPYAERHPGYQLPHSSPSCQFPSGNNSDPLDGLYFASRFPAPNNPPHYNETTNMPPNRSIMNNKGMPQLAQSQSNGMESTNFNLNSWSDSPLNQNVSFTQSRTVPYMPANAYPQSGSLIQGQQGLQTQHSSWNSSWQDNRSHSLQDQAGIGCMNSFNLKTTGSSTQPIRPQFMEPSNSNQNTQYDYGHSLQGSQCQPQPPRLVHHHNKHSRYQPSISQQNPLMASSMNSTRPQTLPNIPPVLHHNSYVSGVARTSNPSNPQFRAQLQNRTRFIPPKNLPSGLKNQRLPVRGPLPGQDRPRTAKCMTSPNSEQGISTHAPRQNSRSLSASALSRKENSALRQHPVETPTSRSTPQDKASKQSTQRKDRDSETHQVAALIVESMLKGHATDHVEQQIRLVNEILKSAPTRNLLSGASSSTSTAICSQASSTSTSSSVNRSSVSQPRSTAAGQSVTLTVESSNSTAGASARNSTTSNTAPLKTGRPRQSKPMFVDLTDDKGTVDTRKSVMQRKTNTVKQTSNNPLINCSPLHQPSISRTTDLDVHIFIEVVNIKSPLSMFCVLERCKWKTCQPKKRKNCKLFLGWWTLQSDRRSNSDCREEDVSYPAARIIDTSQRDKQAFQSETNKIFKNLQGEPREVFQSVATDAVKIIGRAFVRPRSEAGGLYLDAINKSVPGQTTKSYFEMTKTQNLIARMKAACGKGTSTSNPSNVVVIQPLSDNPLPPSEDVPPQQNITSSVPVRLQTTNPIIIEPPPTPAPIVIEDTDIPSLHQVDPIIIAPPPTPAPSVSPDEVLIQWVEGPQPQPAPHHIDPVELQSSVPIVIAPPPTPGPPDVLVNTPQISVNTSIPAAPTNIRNLSFNPANQGPLMQAPPSLGSNSSVPNHGRSIPAGPTNVRNLSFNPPNQTPLMQARPSLGSNSSVPNHGGSIPVGPTSFIPQHQRPQMQDPVSHGCNSSVPNHLRSSNVPIVSTVGNTLKINRCLTQAPDYTSTHSHPPTSQVSVVHRQQPNHQVTRSAVPPPQLVVPPILPQPPPAHQNPQLSFIPPMNLQPLSMLGNMVPNQIPGPQNQVPMSSSILTNQSMTMNSNPHHFALMAQTNAQVIPAKKIRPLIQQNTDVSSMPPSLTVPHIPSPIGATHQLTAHPTYISTTASPVTNVRDPSPNQLYTKKLCPLLPQPITSSVTTNSGEHPRNRAVTLTSTSSSLANKESASTQASSIPQVTSPITTNAGKHPQNGTVVLMSSSSNPANMKRTSTQSSSIPLVTSVVSSAITNENTRPQTKDTMVPSSQFTTPSLTVPAENAATLAKPKDAGSVMYDLKESSFQNTIQPEYVNLEDLMDTNFNMDRGSNPCQPITSSIGTEASQKTSDNIMSYLLDSNLESFMTEAGLIPQTRKFSLVLKKIEDEHVKMGLTKLSSHSYKLPGALAMLKPKRRKIRHTVYTNSDAMVNDDADPEWSPAVTKDEDEEEDTFLDNSDTGSETDLYSDTSSDATIPRNDVSASFDENSPIKKVKKHKRRKIISPEPSSDEDEVPDIPSDWLINKIESVQDRSDSDKGKILISKKCNEIKVMKSDDEEVSGHPCDPVFSPSPMPDELPNTPSDSLINKIDSVQKLSDFDKGKISISNNSKKIRIIKSGDKDPVFSPSTPDKQIPSGKNNGQKPIKIIINTSEGITSLIDHSPIKDSGPKDMPSKNKNLILDVNYIMRASEIIDYKKLASVFPELQPVVKIKRLESLYCEQLMRGRTEQTKSRKRKASPATSTPNKKKKNLSAGLDFFTDEQLWQELNSRQRMVTCVCGMTFVDNELYQCHKASHDSKDPMKCPICQETYSNWHEFTSHSIRSHKNVPNIT